MFDNKNIDDLIQSFFSPIFSQIKKVGLKSSIEKIIPGLFVDDFILKKIKKSLRRVKVINLGHFLGRINMHYRNNYILFDCIGFIGIFLGHLTISNKKIIDISDDIFKQVEKEFFKDEKEIIRKMNQVLDKISKKKSEEKELYDFIMMALFNCYNSTDLRIPKKFEEPFRKLKKTDFTKKFLNFIMEILLEIFDEISNSIHINYDLLFESKVLKFFLNKITDNGKISSINGFINLDLKKLVYDFSNNYAGKSFLRGLGEHLSSMIKDLVIGNSVSYNQIENNFNLTLCIGKDINSRKFRWFGNKNVDEYIEISDDKNLRNPIIVKANKEQILVSRPTVLNLGTVAKYKIEQITKYSVSLFNLNSNKKYFFKIRREGKDYRNSFTINNHKFSNFLVMSDSQGMTKHDYDVFLKTFDFIFKKFTNPEFLVHLGDFVDDGCNENYWDFLLNSEIWGQIPVFPLVGNHESKFHPTLKYAGVRNSIINHFNVEIPDQDRIDKGIYYSFEKNDCIYIFLNTNFFDGLGEKQILWIDNTLKNSKSKWRLLFIHKSPYSCGPHGNDLDVEIIKKEVNELCLKFKFDVVFGGHDHVYSRTKPVCFGKPTEENIYGNKIVNPSGTIFVTLGPIGVKNYKVSEKISSAIEILHPFNNPSFANVTILENKLNVKVYEFSKSYELKIIDEFCIEKDEEEYKIPSKIEQCIDNYPLIPWVYSFDRSSKILNFYNKLSKTDRANVDIRKLNVIIRANLSYERVLNGNISIVFDKNEFLDSLKNPKIRIIIVKSDIIKFENCLGLNRNIVIDRDIFIRGNSKLKFVSFILKSNVTLYIGEGIIIDNNRKQFSIYPSISSFIMKRNCNLVIRDNVWIEQSGGIGLNKKIVNFEGKNCKVFIDSENFKKIPKNFISKKFSNCVFSIFE